MSDKATTAENLAALPGQAWMKELYCALCDEPFEHPVQMWPFDMTAQQIVLDAPYPYRPMGYSKPLRPHRAVHPLCQARPDEIIKLHSQGLLQKKLVAGAEAAKIDLFVLGITPGLDENESEEDDADTER